MFSLGPRMVRPRGWPWNAVACRWSKTTSSSCLSTSSCSRRITSRSRSIALRLEFAVLENIGENVDRGWDVAVEGFGVVDGVFPAGIGVQVAAHILDLELELSLAALLSAFEGEMFEEVGGAVGLVCFGARASIDPDADCGCLGVGGVLGRNLQYSLLVPTCT